MKDLTNIILNNKYQFQKKIGSGSYGIVYSARHLFTGKPYAIKIILKKQGPKNAGANANGGRNNKQLLQELERSLLYQALNNNGTLTTNLLSMDMIIQKGYNCKILREISLQLRVHKHPNILSIYKVYDIDEALFVVMDYFPEGDLFGTIVDKQRYSRDPFLVKSVFVQLVDAITYCHSKGVYHCDLKPENILVADNGTKLILADFGLALREPFIESNVCCGSSYYMSPERIQNFCQGFDTLTSRTMHVERLLHPNGQGMHTNVTFPTSAGDVWSLAIILVNLISIRNPWLKASLSDTTFRAFVKDPAVLLKILPISRDAFHLLCRYLKLNPWERGNLFNFRKDVLACAKLAESGPLSINSRIESMDLITTESVHRKLAGFDVCMVPVDHVAMSRARSKENAYLESYEQEKDYVIGLPLHEEIVPNPGNVATAATAQGMYGPDNPGNGKVCGSCVACGYGVPHAEGYESIESLNMETPIAQELNNELQEQEQHSLEMRHTKKTAGVFRKIFGRRHPHEATASTDSLGSQMDVSNSGASQYQHHQFNFQQFNKKSQQSQTPVQTQIQPRAVAAPAPAAAPRQIVMVNGGRRASPRQTFPQLPFQSPFHNAGVQGRRYTEDELRGTSARNPYTGRYAKIEVDSLLSEYRSMFPSPDAGIHQNNENNVNTHFDLGLNFGATHDEVRGSNHTSGEGSTTDTTTGDVSARTSSASSIDGPEPSCEKRDVRGNTAARNAGDRLAEDLSMVSIMSVKNSSTYMNLDF